ncbi:MAG: hypothetical protein ACK4S3_10115 [Parvibaculum sp.]
MSGTASMICFGAKPGISHRYTEFSLEAETAALNERLLQAFALPSRPLVSIPDVHGAKYERPALGRVLPEATVGWWDISAIRASLVEQLYRPRSDIQRLPDRHRRKTLSVPFAECALLAGHMAKRHVGFPMD